MFRFLLVALLCVFSSALNLNALAGRRAVIARAAAALPLAAVAQQAHAERGASASNAIGTGPNGESAQWRTAASSNSVLGTAKYAGPIGQGEGAVTSAIGLDGKKVDVYGSAAPAGKAALAASSTIAPGGYKSDAAMARLMK